jgi:hypothetical protein
MSYHNWCHRGRMKTVWLWLLTRLNVQKRIATSHHNRWLGIITKEIALISQRAAKPRRYWVFSPIMRVLRPMCMLHNVWLKAIVYIYNCWGVSVRKCIIKSRKSGNPASGKFTMTIHLSIQPSLCCKFLLNHSTPRASLATRLIWHSTNFLFPKRK